MIGVAENLRRAADLIDERGFAIGPMGMTGERGYCAEGALYHVMAGEDLAHASGGKREAAYSYIAKSAEAKAMLRWANAHRREGEDRFYVHLFTWSDRRQKREVTEALRDCADAVEAEKAAN